MADQDYIPVVANPVPASFANVGGEVTRPITWQGTFSTDVPVDWKRRTAVYTTFSTDYSEDRIKPTHGNACAYAYANSDPAGTPQGFTGS